MNARTILREGWFDKVVTFFKGTGSDAQRLANAWLSEQELELGHDLDENFKNAVIQFVTNRYERALKIYEDDPEPARKASRVLVGLLDKRFSEYIDDLIAAQEESSYSKKRKRLY